MEHEINKDQIVAAQKSEEVNSDFAIGEELTDDQLLQMAEGSCSWGANCSKGC